MEKKKSPGKRWEKPNKGGNKRLEPNPAINFSLAHVDLTKGPVPTGRAAEVGSVLELQTCPYNESHRVGGGSFAEHLWKCRKSLPPEIRKNYWICKYNATHHMLRSLYPLHLELCPDYREFIAASFRLPPDMFGYSRPQQELITEKEKRAREEMRRKNQEREAERRMVKEGKADDEMIARVRARERAEAQAEDMFLD